MKQLTVKRKATKYIVMTAVFAAMGFALSFIEIPMPPPVAFLKLDFSTVMTMLCGFILGPVAMISAEGIKQLLWFFTHSTTGGIGEIGNFIISVMYGIIPAILYKFRKGRKNVIIGLAAGCVLQVIGALLCNLYITFPMYMGDSALSAFVTLLPYLIAFNAGKSLLVSIITFVLYKSLSRAMKFIFGEDQDETCSPEKASDESGTGADGQDAKADSLQGDYSGDDLRRKN